MFYKEIQHLNWNEVSYSILEKTAQDVEIALKKKDKNLEDFKALISPKAAPFLEEMAALSQRISQERFGKTIQMYTPIYLSNECNNICTYCGFSQHLQIPRKTLNSQEVLQEIQVIKEMGYDHILIVTGEHYRNVDIDYFCQMLPIFSKYFSHISMEVQPLSVEKYQKLIDLGVDTVLVYQETYHQNSYKKYHPKGKKSNYLYRLDTCDRLGEVGIHKMGLGVLLGLEDWRTDSFFCAKHLSYLEKKYWRSKYSISFPRLRTCAQSIPKEYEISDRELVQLICAYRIFNQEVELSISTRESPAFRNGLINLGITSMSADSRTNPGGYAQGRTSSLNQFDIMDHRTTEEVCQSILYKGYEPVWKDWDAYFQNGLSQER